MKEQSIIEVGESRPGWEALEAYARESIQAGCSNCWRKRSRRPWAGGGMSDGRVWMRGRATGTGGASRGG